MNTIYLNQFGDRINQDQLGDSGNYTKVVVDPTTNKWLIEFQYAEGILQATIYNVYSPAELSALLAANTDIIIKHRYTSGGYEIEEWLTYQSSALVEKLLLVSMSEEAIICSESYLLPANIPDYSETVKHSFDSSGYMTYGFYYDAAGNCIRIIDGGDAQGDIDPSEIGVNPHLDFSWSDYSYYLHAYPTIPTGPV